MLFFVFFRKMYTKQWLVWNHTTAGMYMPVPSCTISYHHWLVVWNMNYFIFPFHIWDNPSQLTFIFFRGVGQPPTIYIYICIVIFMHIQKVVPPWFDLSFWSVNHAYQAYQAAYSSIPGNPVNNQTFSMVCFPMIAKNNYITKMVVSGNQNKFLVLNGVLGIYITYSIAC